MKIKFSLITYPGYYYPVDGSPDGRYFTYGGTLSSGLAYYIDQINTTFNLGFRYQVLKYFQKDGNAASNTFDGQFDHFFGITFCVVYTFRMGKK